MSMRQRYMQWITQKKASYAQATYGFTLIETLVAITILSLAISGPLYSANRTIIAAQISSDKLTASYLAQEGLEYVHAIRDNNYLAYYKAGGSKVSARAWTNFRNITARCISSAGCTLDPWNPSSVVINAPVACPTTGCSPLYLSSNGYTQQSRQPNTRTQFTRTISIESVTLNGGQNEVKVVSEVKWNFHNIPYSIKATDRLTSWQ